MSYGLLARQLAGYPVGQSARLLMGELTRQLARHSTTNHITRFIAMHLAGRVLRHITMHIAKQVLRHVADRVSRRVAKQVAGYPADHTTRRHIKRLLRQLVDRVVARFHLASAAFVRISVVHVAALRPADSVLDRETRENVVEAVRGVAVSEEMLSMGYPALDDREIRGILGENALGLFASTTVASR